MLYTLGRAAEQVARHQAAAEYYLRSALLADGKAPDAFARQARLAAALALVQAGLREDARAQFQWLIRNTTDPAQLAIAKRELAMP
jgi:predicted negative regulator of RcsB-dependent stress response